MKDSAMKDAAVKNVYSEDSVVKSAYLTSNQLDALARIGDLMIPGEGDAPAFGATGCIEFIDDILTYTPASDVRELAGLLGVLALLPDGLLSWVIKLAESAEKFPGFIAAPLRLLDLGLRGITFSLYYSGKTGLLAETDSFLDKIGYELHCEPDA
jgi:hypothetical protein